MGTVSSDLYYRPGVASAEIEVSRPVALVTGVGRRVGIGAAISRRLAAQGWDVATTCWRAYDRRMPWGGDAAPSDVVAELEALGARCVEVEADLSDASEPARVFAAVNAELGPVRALVLSHCDGADGGILDTGVAEFDRVFAVNARATWLLVQTFAMQFPGPHGSGRIVSLTSDHTAGNLAYGSSKGAMDRIVLAAAVELADRGITANAVNPGPTDTGWMDDELKQAVIADTLAGRLGTAEDAANLVAFLCSAEGGWINGQLLQSDGGFGQR